MRFVRAAFVGAACEQSCLPVSVIVSAAGPYCGWSLEAGCVDELSVIGWARRALHIEGGSTD
jgi:hypothetical protein